MTAVQQQQQQVVNNKNNITTGGTTLVLLLQQIAAATFPTRPFQIQEELFQIQEEFLLLPQPLFLLPPTLTACSLQLLPYHHIRDILARCCHSSQQYSCCHSSNSCWNWCYCCHNSFHMIFATILLVLVLAATTIPQQHVTISNDCSCSCVNPPLSYQLLLYHYQYQTSDLLRFCITPYSTPPLSHLSQYQLLSIIVVIM